MCNIYPFVLSWEAHYVAELKERTLGLDAWVEIHNESGITFSDTRLKLLAGQVNRVLKDLAEWYSPTNWNG